MAPAGIPPDRPDLRGTSRALDGKIALVTGAASGIGRATSRLLAEKGAQVVVADVQEEPLRALAEEASARGGAALALPTDVAAQDSVRRLEAAIAERFGRLDIAVNAAGVTGPANLLLDVSLESFDRCLAVNLTGVWLCMSAELRLMIPNRTGVIINIASTAGLRGSRRASPYVASKHAVLGLTKAAALDYGDSGVRINAVCPGPTETAQTAPILKRPEIRQAMLRRVPVRRFAQPEEIANAVLWLASDEATFVTGAAFVLDGGQTAA